jgi:hypothetical protein
MVLGWRLSAAILIAGFVAWSGCKDENPVDGDSSSSVVFPASGVSYGRHVQPLFNQACAFAGCHDDGPHPSSLRLTSYDNLMYNSMKVVERGLPEQSVLVWRIEGSVGPRMPLNGRPLNQNQINGIRTWITEGALNN